MEQQRQEERSKEQKDDYAELIALLKDEVEFTNHEDLVKVLMELR